LPKLRVAGLTASDPRAEPVPESPTVRLGFEAFDVIATLPVALPAVDGAKIALNVKLCPGASVKGALIPLTLKPAPDATT
jgi:hypothetical protein